MNQLFRCNDINLDMQVTTSRFCRKFRHTAPAYCTLLSTDRQQAWLRALSHEVCQVRTSISEQKS